MESKWTEPVGGGGEVWKSVESERKSAAGFIDWHSDIQTYLRYRVRIDTHSNTLSVPLRVHMLFRWLFQIRFSINFSHGTIKQTDDTSKKSTSFENLWAHIPTYVRLCRLYLNLADTPGKFTMKYLKLFYSCIGKKKKKKKRIKTFMY